VVHGNLSSAFYCVAAVLPTMRRQKDGVLIHTASLAGRWSSILSGAAYSATKHAVVAMSHVLNMEECVSGIRSTVLCPGEVATPILEKRPIPVSAEERARMVQPEIAATSSATSPACPPTCASTRCWIGPTWNRTYVANLQRQQAQATAKGK
jgi:NAD(P)-dependent dehydrogenase (short-subunit alcohol dehydrogenase family)